VSAGSQIDPHCEAVLQVDAPKLAGTGASAGFYALVEKLAIPLGVCVSLVAFFRFVIYASRHLWFDEIHTLVYAQQPTWADVWRAYGDKVDLQQPLFIIVSRVSWMLLGRNELALRFPAILGMLLFSWCLFFFVGKRLGYVLGLCAMILPLVTDMEFYAGEARPYGMLLGFFGLALLAWRNAIENPRRRYALPLFAATLLLMVSTHAYAIVTVGVFGLAELVRWAENRKPDLPLWTCFLAALPPLSFYLRPMQSFRTASVNPTRWAGWGEFPFFYQYFFRNRLLLIVLMGMLAVALALLRKGRKPSSPGLPIYEAVFAYLLSVSPIISVALAVFVTSFVSPRYSICAMAGIAMTAILVIDAIAPSRHHAALALLFVSVLLFGLDQRYGAFNRPAMETRDAQLIAPFASVPDDAPLVVASGLAFLPTEIYSSAGNLDRTFYLMDNQAGVKYTGSTNFTALPDLGKYLHYRAHLVDYSAFVKEHRKFYAFGPYTGVDDWQIRKLLDDGARLVEKGRYNGEFTDNFLFEVQMP
jgi:hypothetical protein